MTLIIEFKVFRYNKVVFINHILGKYLILLWYIEGTKRKRILLNISFAKFRQNLFLNLHFCVVYKIKLSLKKKILLLINTHCSLFKFLGQSFGSSPGKTLGCVCIENG